MMSFSQEVKNELLLKEKLSNVEIMSELSSVIMICGALTFQNKNTKISIETENNPLVRKLFVLIKKLYSYEAKIQFIEKGQIRKKNRYKVLIEDDKTVGKILEDMSLGSISLAFLTPNINKNLIDNNKKYGAYLRGSFLGGGYMANPSKSYHLEMVVDNYNYAEELKKLMEMSKLKPKIAKRKEKYIVYLKDSEKISDFLAITGAVNSKLKFENIKAIKDVKNQTNRAVNCDEANINKILKASTLQIEAIEKIDRILGLENLNDDLKELSKLRLENEEYSLEQLGAKMSKPLSKSAVNYRFKKIFDIAENLKK